MSTQALSPIDPASAVQLLDASLPRHILAEGPLWNPVTQTLFWVDIAGKRIHRYALETRRHQVQTLSLMPGFITLCDDGGLLAGLEDGLYLLPDETSRATPLAKPPGLKSGVRFNDGKCGPDGTLFAGTIPLPHLKGQEVAVLYRYRGGAFTTLDSGLKNSNGLAWSPDGSRLYHADTGRQTIWQYDYDAATGEASHRRVFHLFRHDRPDGIATDSIGRVYVALYGGWRIDVLSAQGKLEGEIAMPVPNVTSCAFGGSDLKTLFITTASEGMDEAALAKAPLSGQIFQTQVNVPGLLPGVFRRNAST